MTDQRRPEPQSTPSLPDTMDVLQHASGVGVAALDSQGRVVTSSPAFERLTGDLSSETILDVVAEGQRDTAARFLERLGDAWSRLPVSLQLRPDTEPADRVLWMRRTDSGYDLIVDSPAAITEPLGQPYRQLVDALVETQRDLNRRNAELHEVIRDLESARAHVRQLESLVPLCAWCRRLRLEGDQTHWVSLEDYLGSNNVLVSHGICPDCAARIDPGQDASVGA